MTRGPTIDSLQMIEDVGSDEQKLTIIEHLEELRRRLVVCAVSVVITTVVALLFVNRIFEILLAPAPTGFKMIYTEMTEMLTTYFKVGILSGVAASLPVIVYEFVRFVAPAMTRQEKRYFFILLPGVVACFLGGVTFGYFLLLPWTVKYLLTFSDIAEPFIKVGSYVSFVSTMLFFVGLAFETPVVLFFLAKIRVVNSKKLASWRKYAFVGAFAVGAIITPTVDPIGQSIVAVPIMLLWEIGVLLARVA